MTGECPIEIMGLRKEYGEFVAVDDLSLNVKKNSFTGFLGPNGAGKSTTLKILTNLIHSTSGSAYLNGIDVITESKKALIGVGTVVETPELYSYLTPREVFSFAGELYGMNKESISAETEEILSEVKMLEWGDKKLGTFSKGMKQRISLGLSLMNDPNIIILDEPTSGLDPRGMAETRDILKDIRQNSKNLTILMSSHMLHEVTDLCDHVALVNRGELLLHDKLDAVISSNKARLINIKTIASPNEDMLSLISSLSNVDDVSVRGDMIEVRFNGDNEDQLRFFNDVGSLGIGVFNLHENDALESVYLSLIADTR